MADTVTIPNTPPASEDASSFEGHLAAAKAFFPTSADKPPEAPPAKADEKPAEKPAAPAKTDIVGSLVKGIAKPAEAKVETVPPEEIDKGLAAPRSDSPSRAGWDELKKRAAERVQASEAKIRELENKLKESALPAADEAVKARLAELKG